MWQLPILFPPYLGINTTAIGRKWIVYVSPYCIVFTIFAIVLFSKIELQSRLINWIAASSFAVYLIHTNPNTFYYFKDFFVRLHDGSDGFLFWLYTFGVLILIFIVAVMIDQIRIVLWTLLWNKLKKRAELKRKTSRWQPWAKSRKNYFRRCFQTSIFASGDQALHTDKHPYELRSVCQNNWQN